MPSKQAMADSLSKLKAQLQDPIEFVRKQKEVISGAMQSLKEQLTKSSPQAVVDSGKAVLAAGASNIQGRITATRKTLGERASTLKQSITDSISTSAGPSTSTDAENADADWKGLKEATELYHMFRQFQTRIQAVTVNLECLVVKTNGLLGGYCNFMNSCA